MLSSFILPTFLGRLEIHFQGDGGDLVPFVLILDAEFYAENIATRLS